MSETRFTDQKDASRYTLHVGDDLVSALDYNDDGRSVAMTRAFTPPPFRGKGYAAEIVAPLLFRCQKHKTENWKQNIEN